MRRLLCVLISILLVLSFAAPALAEETLYCRICGRQIPSDSRVCPYCGVAVVHVGDDAEREAGDSSPATDAPASVSPAVSTPDAGPFTPVPGPFGSILSAEGYSGVRITKSPTSESVPYGGSCLFIAHAVNASSITWYLANANTSVIIPASEAPAYVSGLSVSGWNSDTLSLSGIPSWMNGYMVQACFEGEGGPVYTDIARIWTYEETRYEPGYCSRWSQLEELAYLWRYYSWLYEDETIDLPVSAPQRVYMGPIHSSFTD